jgi:putative ABC transport system permease protein
MENANGGMTLTGRGDPLLVPSRTVSGNFFATLGVQPALGRTLIPSDDDVASPPVVVLSDALWRRQFGADKTIVGAPLTLDGRPFTVAGVMPRQFTYPAGATMWVSARISRTASTVCRRHTIQRAARNSFR